MLEIGAILVFVGVLIFASHFFAWLFSHTKIPDALLLMLVGLLVGPVLGLLDPSFFGDAGELVVMVVLVILLFQSGLGLKWSVVRQAWQGTLRLSVANFAATMALVGVILWLIFDFHPLIAFMVGSIVGGTSSAVVIPLLKQLTVSDESRAMLTLESVFSDVLTIVITFALLEAYEIGSINVGIITWDVLMSFVGAAVIGVIVALVWSRLLSTVRQMKNSILTTPAIVFVLFGFVEALNLSGPIAALAFGIMMGNVANLNNWLGQRSTFLRYVFWLTPLSKREKIAFSEIVFLLQTFFFVFVGISIQLESWGPAIIGLSLALLLMFLRPVVIRYVMPKTVPVHDVTVMATVVPKGLAAAALASLPLQRGIADGALIQETTYAIILFSVVITSVLIFAVHRTGLVNSYTKFFSKFGEEEDSAAAL